MMSAPVPSGTRDSRVLVFSQRALHRPVWHAWEYELEDLLLRFDDTSLVAPGRTGLVEPVSAAGRRLANGLVRRVGGRRTFPPNIYPSMQRTRITSDHDLFFAVIDDPYQLAFLRRLEGWRERATRTACLLVELWTPDLAAKSDYLELLRDFDDVYVFNSAVLPGLQPYVGGRTAFLPVGVDALQAAPLPGLPERVLDVYSFGRNSTGIHQQLLSLADQRGLTYLYDTVSATTAPDYAAHRALMANMMKRAHYFLAHRINDSPERRARTGGDEGMSTRYFEGMAGGAVLLGSRSLGSDFDHCFDWEDAVIPLPYDSADVPERLVELAHQPQRLARARSANVRNTLLRHDWVYRWERVLCDSGLSPTPVMQERRQRLQATADTVSPEVMQAGPAWGARKGSPSINVA